MTNSIKATNRPHSIIKEKFLLVLLPAVLFSCSQAKPSAPERLPDNEVAAYREASKKIIPYISLEDSAYHITITKDEALQLGVPEKYFMRMSQEIEYTNYLIKEEYNSKGIKIDLSEMPISTELK